VSSKHVPAPSKPIGLLQPLDVRSRNWEHVTKEDFILDLLKKEAMHDVGGCWQIVKAMTLMPTKFSISAQRVA
jgi:hypothetical protein